MWEIPEGWIPRISAIRLEVKPSLFINCCNFSFISGIFTKINIFFCKTTILYDCKMLIVVDNVYKCNYSNMVKYLRILCVNYLYI